MYSIFTYIWAIYGVNVGKYSIHGAYGYKAHGQKKQHLLCVFVSPTINDNDHRAEPRCVCSAVPLGHLLAEIHQTIQQCLPTGVEKSPTCWDLDNLDIDNLDKLGY